jgi:hypothetical protein
MRYLLVSLASLIVLLQGALAPPAPVTTPEIKVLEQAELLTGSLKVRHLDISSGSSGGHVSLAPRRPHTKRKVTFNHKASRPEPCSIPPFW